MTAFNNARFIGGVNTPAIIYDEQAIINTINILKSELEYTCIILFPIKACNCMELLRILSNYANGFSVSSAFEARLAASFCLKDFNIHYTSPSIKDSEIGEIANNCNYVSFNSLTQLNKYCKYINSKNAVGLRINTELSFVKDRRYDPCRKYSKLGVSLTTLCKEFDSKNELIQSINGLLFHTNCESESYGELYQNILLLEKKNSDLLHHIEWINIGGGYLINNIKRWDYFREAVSLLRNKFDLEVIFEPGKGIIGDAGIIISSVVDIFESGDKAIAILDTTVNHMPEVFEYQYKPRISNSVRNGKYRYILAGASCLAGDIIGEYSFKTPLRIGSRIVFEEMGAYTMVKANMFNGINLPSIYLLDSDQNLKLIKQFSYEDFLSRCGEASDETAREININTESNSEQQSHRIFSR